MHIILASDKTGTNRRLGTAGHSNKYQCSQVVAIFVMNEVLLLLEISFTSIWLIPLDVA